MIRWLEGFPQRIVAIAADGLLTRQDYERMLIPRVNALLQRHEKLRIYYELGAGFTGFEAGAAWEDMKLGLGHLQRWERMAVVTDIRWIRAAREAFGFLMPGGLRVFDSAHSAEARRWIEADLA